MDFLISPLGWKNWLLLIAALINLGMAIFIFSRGIKNKVNLYFSLLTFFCFTWAIGLCFARWTTDLFWTSIFARSTYISALCIALSLFYFALTFPFPSKGVGKKLTFLVWLFFIFLSFLTYTKWFITSFISAYSAGEYISFFYLPGYIAYFIYFGLIAIFALSNLFKKYKILEGAARKNLLLLFFTILIGLIFGTYFDLFLLIFQDFRFNWFGPVFTIFMNSLVFYLLIFSKEK
ncbi:hypothetical protein KBC40_01375 [Patescibacteria group bacterium]|nr:hypothetical protein [Patescibacteria group bacterium]